MYADTSTSTSLVTSKTRVAPLATTTIPRLELCGAQLLSKLLQTVKDALNVPLLDVYAWCDSSITLGWINSSQSKLKTFIANRVADITVRIPPSNWRYISTEHNQADVASRGASPRELLGNELWWKGPPWLTLSPNVWPTRTDLYKLPEVSLRKSY